MIRTLRVPAAAILQLASAERTRVAKCRRTKKSNAKVIASVNCTVQSSWIARAIGFIVALNFTPVEDLRMVRQVNVMLINRHGFPGLAELAVDAIVIIGTA